MSVIGRIVGLAVVGMAGAMAVGAAGAMSAKQRIVPTTDPADDEITLASIFGPLAYRSTSTNFRGGTIECWYGGGAVDLRDATLAPEGATLTLKAVVVFGGFQVLSELDEGQEEWLRSQEAAADSVAASKAKVLDVPDELSPANGAEPEMTPAG